MQLDIQMRWKRKKEREIEENTIWWYFFKLNGGKIYDNAAGEFKKKLTHTNTQKAEKKP